MNCTSITRWAIRAAAATAIAAAGFAVTVPAGADPVWPGGPDIPGIPQLVPAPPGLATAPCSAAARACLRLSTNEGWLMDNGRVVYGPTPISHGRPGYETPPGTFHVAFKEPYHWSTMHNAEMRWAVFFNGDIATHIGPIEEKSHGCIRMTPEGAKAFYDYVNPGDVFEVVP
ncbi:L,D-transpeptidase [Nocardia sp. NPDC052254]|uniref:L,D-transpeptidase n=1 Tax=Nocardia sp. NPDC052254 TaxID=3155681 RepID=UPI00342DA051